MPHIEIEGALQGQGLRVAVAVARFNSFVTDRLLGGALDGLRRHGVAEADTTVVRVPGSWELPITVKALAESGKYDAIICLGAVIRGDTPHFDYVAGEAAKGIGQAMMQTGVPVAFGAPGAAEIVELKVILKADFRGSVEGGDRVIKISDRAHKRRCNAVGVFGAGKPVRPACLRCARVAAP